MRILGFAGVASLWLLCAGPAMPQSKPAPTPRDIPTGAQSVLSATLGSADRAYRAKRTPQGYVTENPTSHLSAQYTANGVEIRFQNAELALEFHSWGYGEHAPRQDKASAATRVGTNRLEYRRGSLTEWYVNGPFGIEQGFTILQPSAPVADSRSEPLNIALRLGGNLTPRVDAGRQALSLRDQYGVEALRYGPLLAYDASGRKLESWLEERRGQLRLRVNTAGARYPVVVDPFVQSAQLNVDGVSGAPGDLGTAIAVSDDGTVVVAGACGSDPTTGGCPLPASVQPMGDSSTPYEGKAFVFVEPQAGWGPVTTTPTAILTAPDTAIGDGFGSAVAINAAGTTIAVSAPQHQCQTVGGAPQCQGEAYVFSVSAAADWPSVAGPAVLMANGAAIGDFFGSSLAMDQAGDTIVAREFNPTTDEGHVNVYVRSGAAWTSASETLQLESSDISPFDNFGEGLGISGDGKTVVVGSFAANLFAGEAYVFVEPVPGGWTSAQSPTLQSATLLNSDASVDGELGNAAAVDQAGDTVVIGAFGQLQQGGEAYVYFEGSGWSGTRDETTRLEANATNFSESFGSDVSISDDGSTIAVGSNAGGVYLFSEPPQGWPTASPTPILESLTNPVELLPTVTSGTNQFVIFNGVVSGNTVASGATGAVLVSVPANNSNAGTVFVYSEQASTCPTITISSSPSPLAAATVGVSYTAQFTTNDANTPLQWSISSAPTWLSINPSTGVLSGTPPAGSGPSVSVAVGVTDMAGCTGGAAFALTVNAPPAEATTTIVTSISSTVSGAALPATFALVENPVVVNFTVVPQAGGTGTPTGTVTVTDATGDSCHNPVSTGSCLLNFSQAGSFTLTATYVPDSASFLGSMSTYQPPETVVQILTCGSGFSMLMVPDGEGAPVYQEICVASDLNTQPTGAVIDCVVRATCVVTIKSGPAGSGLYTVEVDFVTRAAGAAGSLSSANPNLRGRPWRLGLVGFGVLLAIAMALQLARQHGVRLRRTWAAASFLFVLLVLGGMPACSSIPEAPPGTYTMHVKITAGNSSIVVPFTVVVTK